MVFERLRTSLVLVRVASMHPLLPWASVGQVKFLDLLFLVIRHHLDGLVVLILVSSQGDCVRPQEVVHGIGIRHPRVGNGYPRREHLILARIEGELYPCAGAPTRTRGELPTLRYLGKTSASLLLFTSLQIYIPHLLL